MLSPAGHPNITRTEEVGANRLRTHSDGGALWCLIYQSKEEATILKLEKTPETRPGGVFFLIIDLIR